MPGGHPHSGRELPEQVVGFGSLQRDWVQAPRAVPPQGQAEHAPQLDDLVESGHLEYDELQRQSTSAEHAVRT